MKKRSIMLICAVMLLSGCGAEEAASDAAAENVSEITSVSSENTEISADTNTENVSETENTAVSLSENNEDDFHEGYFSKPSHEFLNDAFGEENYHYWIKYSEDKKYTSISYEESDKLMYREYYKSLLTEDSYRDYKEYYEVDISFEEYCDQIKGIFGIDVDELENDDEKPYVIFNVLGDSDDDICSYSETAFVHLIGLLNSDDERVSEIKNMLGTAQQINIFLRFEAENDVIKMSAHYSDEAGGTDDPKEIFSDEYISASGRDVINVAGYPVYADCKSLYLSAYDDTAGGMLDNGESENFENVIFDFGEDGSERIVDIAEIVEKLPNLEKLYLSNYITLKNASAISEFEHLDELFVGVSDVSDIKALSGVSVKKLGVSGIDFPADALSDVNADELIIDCTGSPETLKSIFKLKNVTSLTIDRYGGSDYELDGIGALSDLKKLDLSTSHLIDLAPLEKLENLEDLEIMAYSTKNLDKIAGLKNVKYLMLHSMDGDDLSFLSKMTGLEELRLMYVNSSFNSALGNLKNLKKLSLSDISGTVDYGSIYELPDIEYLSFMGMDISAKDISKADKLEYLNIMLCSYGDLSELKKCGSLKNLMIYNCDTPYFDAKEIYGMTQLEKLSFNCSEIDNYKSLKSLTGLKNMNLFFCNLSSEEIDDLRGSLPDCEIALDTD